MSPAVYIRAACRQDDVAVGRQAPCTHLAVRLPRPPGQESRASLPGRASVDDDDASSADELSLALTSRMPTSNLHGPATSGAENRSHCRSGKVVSAEKSATTHLGLYGPDQGV